MLWMVLKSLQKHLFFLFIIEYINIEILKIFQTHTIKLCTCLVYCMTLVLEILKVNDFLNIYKFNLNFKNCRYELYKKKINSNIKNKQNTNTNSLVKVNTNMID